MKSGKKIAIRVTAIMVIAVFAFVVSVMAQDGGKDVKPGAAFTDEEKISSQQIQALQAPATVTVSPYSPEFVLTGDEDNGDVYYFPSNGDGTFGARSYIGAFGTADGLAIAYFDNDGDPDFIVGEGSTDTVYLYNNDGTGTFTSSAIATIPTAGWFSAFRAADFNNDGYYDFVCGDFWGSQYVFINNGDGTFTQSILDTSWTIYPLLPKDVGDFDKDGNMDIIMVDMYGEPTSGDVYLYRGNGDGTFAYTQVIDLGADVGAYDPVGLASGDFDNDGYLDIAIGGDGSSSSTDYGAYWLYKGDGAGGFAYVGKVFDVQGTGMGQAGADAYDFDGDGNMDIVAYNWGGTTFFFIKGNGDGTFATPTAIDSTLGNGIGIAAPPEALVPPPPPVGGEIYPINKVAVLAPWLALGLAIIAGVAIVWRRRRVPS